MKEEVTQTILIIEDNEDDVFAVTRALKQAQISNRLQVVDDGQKALDYFSGTGPYADRERYPIPFLVFLDLKLPYVSGFEVLAWIRQRPVFNPVVVVVLTSSDETKDHQKAYSLGARSYLVKPPSAEELRQFMDSLQSHWSRYYEIAPVLMENAGPAE